MSSLVVAPRHHSLDGINNGHQGYAEEERSIDITETHTDEEAESLENNSPIRREDVYSPVKCNRAPPALAPEIINKLELSPLLGHSTPTRTNSLQPSPATHYVRVVIYGIVNAILTIPVCFGFTAIIYSHPSYAPYLPVLAKLVLWSSVVHQVMFSFMSSLPFAIGQVQDAGLVFLSHMATSIAVSLKAKGASTESLIATSLIGTAISTAALGFVVVLLGKFKLASLVSYLPMPVIGGYLAYIGQFCFMAGLEQSTGLSIMSVVDFPLLFNLHSIILVTPAILGGVMLLLVAQRSKHFASLPGAIVSMPIAFFIVLLISGYSMSDARSSGWVGEAPDFTEPFYKIFVNFDFAHVYWSALPPLIPTWLAMVFVVSFSSCLDVTAIEMDMGEQLKINHELQTVGWSNFVSGLLGGYTGSYIFSQTIFTSRTKTNSRLVGWIVAIAELVIFVAPYNVTSYLPKFFFAGTLIFIAIDLMIEWLYAVWWRLLPREYAVLVSTFVAINIVGLQEGILIGLGVAVVNFVLGYANIVPVRSVHRESHVVRSYDESSMLSARRSTILTLELSGYLFFGSAMQILKYIEDHVYISSKSSKDRARRRRSKHTSHGSFGSFGNDTFTKLNAEGEPWPSVKSPAYYAQLHSEFSLATLSGRFLGPEELLKSSRTLYVVLDFARVTGLDATAARSAFSVAVQLCARERVKVLFAGLSKDAEYLLRVNGVIRENSSHTSVFATLQDALAWCEDELIEREWRLVENSGSPAHRHKSITSESRLPDILRCFLGLPASYTGFEKIDKYAKRLDYSARTTIYCPGARSDELYILVSGNVHISLPAAGFMSPHADRVLTDKLRPGVVFGEIDFLLEQPRQTFAEAVSDCVVFMISRAQYLKMAGKDPKLHAEFLSLLLKEVALTIGKDKWLLT